MSFKAKLIQLNELNDLIEDVQSAKLKESLQYKLQSDLDRIIHKHELLYHNTFSNKKNRAAFVKNSQKEKHQHIVQTQSTLNAFLPYVLMYNLQQQE